MTRKSCALTGLLILLGNSMTVEVCPGRRRTWKEGDLEGRDLEEFALSSQTGKRLALSAPNFIRLGR